jgi:hypothetical protein
MSLGRGRLAGQGKDGNETSSTLRTGEVGLRAQNSQIGRAE